MSGELTLVIRRQDSHDEFKLENFKEFCQEACGGTISEVTKSGTDWTLSWSGNKYVLQEVIKKAENGDMDRWIEKRNGSYLLELTENEECLYSYVPELEIETQTPSSVDFAELQPLASEVDVLLVTATPIEQDAVLAEMKPWPERQEIIQGVLVDTTYIFGRFGRYRTAHVRCTMGAGGRRGAMATTLTAIQELQPKAVLILGIAFGIDRKKQRLGDVIVAESVHPYELERVGVSSTLKRGQAMNCGTTLSERFYNNSSTWQLECGSRLVKVHQGPILSGEKLIDNREFRDQLVQNYCETAEGGEMEGAGAYAAAEKTHTESILVKGICDWADGHKNDRAQSFAAHAAVSLAKHVLNKPNVLNRLGAVDLESSSANELSLPPESSEHSSLVKLFRVSQLTLKPTREKISLINHYKSLHDEFQDLESLNKTVKQSYVKRILPEKDPAWEDELPPYNSKLQNHVNNIVKELEDKEVKREIRNRRIRWQKTLRQAEDEFNQAIDQKEQKKLKHSVELIETVLRPGLSFMNDSLVNTVKELQLHGSVEALKILRTESIFERLKKTQLSRFENNLKKLEDMEQRIEFLLPIHNDFQGIDNELDKIGTELKPKSVDVTQVFPLYWEILGRMLGEMCGEKKDKWANQIRQQRQELESAMTENDASKIRQSFMSLRSTVSFHFNKIDTELKEVCRDLKSSGDVLDTLLIMIPDLA